VRDGGVRQSRQAEAAAGQKTADGEVIATWRTYASLMPIGGKTEIAAPRA
jgi:hypothetical protein